MDVASIQAELHRYYDKLIAGICLIGMDESEPILFVNRGLLDMYHCGDEGEFYRLTGKVRKGMIEAADYRPLDKADDAGRPKFITFRFRTADGSYHWTVFLVLLLRVDNRQDLLLCCREDVWETARDRKSLLPILATSFGIHELEPARQPYFSLLRELCQAMIHYSGIKFFWKDRARRFAGVSQSFLDYYGLKDLGWIVNDRVYRDAEMAVLEKGQVTRDVLGQCLVRGRLHQIASTKFPIYRGKRIIGLLGYFEDVDEDCRHQERLHQASLVDAETGLLNFRGLWLLGEDYMDAYRRYGTDYVCVLLEVPEYEQVFRDYGDEVAGKLLQAITDQLLTLHSLKGSLAHLSGCRFFYITHQSLDRDFRNTLLGLTNAIHSLTDIGSYSCTLYLQYAIVQGSEGRDFDEIMQLLRERLKDAEEQRYGQAVYIGDRLVFDKEKFDKLDEEVYIIDPDTYELVYINEYMQKSYGFSDAYCWVGEKCYKLLSGLDGPCEDCINGQLRRDCFCTTTRRNCKTGQNLLMRTTLIPWQGKNYRFSMAADLNQYISRDLAENRVIFREADPNVGLQKMLAHIGHSLQAERVLLFEEQDGQVSATYEWHQEDLQPVAHTVQHIPINSLRPLYAKFDTKQMAIIEDVQSFLRDNPGFTPYISGVRRLVSGHLTQSGRSLGFTEVINPSALAFKSAGLLLSTLTLFLTIMLRNRDIFRSLERLGATDQLTGVGNRRGFAEYLRALPDGMSLAFIFGDLNGLKQTNDTQGHEAGDQLICQAARIMKSLTDDSAVFRMGGDEFMLVVRNVDKTQARRILRDLRARYRSSGISMALGCIVCHAPIVNIDDVISQVDREMYADKERIYGRHQS